jgi:hypothetical protein
MQYEIDNPHQHGLSDRMTSCQTTVIQLCAVSGAKQQFEFHAIQAVCVSMLMHLPYRLDSALILLRPSGHCRSLIISKWQYFTANLCAIYYSHLYGHQLKCLDRSYYCVSILFRTRNCDHYHSI